MDYSAYQLLWFFLVYAFLGWLGETALAAAKKRRLLNRGFLSAPSPPSTAWPEFCLPSSCLSCGKTSSSCSCSV